MASASAREICGRSLCCARAIPLRVGVNLSGSIQPSVTSHACMRCASAGGTCSSASITSGVMRRTTGKGTPFLSSTSVSRSRKFLNISRTCRGSKPAILSGRSMPISILVDWYHTVSTSLFSNRLSIAAIGRLLDIGVMFMPQNEFGYDVPPNVEEVARKYACLGGTRYIYRDGEYAGRRPVASVGCRRATRFGSSNYERHKIQLCDGWVAFRSPSYNGALESTEFPAQDRELFDATLDAVLRLTDPRGYSPSDDSWLQEAIQATERSIDALVREFLEAPYLHRVEHSLHMRLWDLLRSQSGDFAGTFHLGDDLAVTQLVHKEWPETFARPEKNNRRGNFDIVVLSPKLLAGCQTIEEFREGRLPAPIVVEMGL